MPELRLCVATPIDGTPDTGTVSCRYASRLADLYRNPNVGLVPQHLVMSGDVVRARNRAVRWVLEDSWNATHVLWWDEDVDPGPGHMDLINRMLQTGKHIVAAPYPMKRADGKIPIVSHTPRLPDPIGGCVPVAAIGFGFMLTTTFALRAMCEKYAAEWYYDVQSDQSFHRTIGLFNLKINTRGPEGFDGEWRELLSEDYSFCLRACEAGIQPWMYVGDGTPLAHIGRFAYRAQPVIQSRGEPR